MIVGVVLASISPILGFVIGLPLSVFIAVYLYKLAANYPANQNWRPMKLIAATVAISLIALVLTVTVGLKAVSDLRDLSSKTTQEDSTFNVPDETQIDPGTEDPTAVPTDPETDDPAAPAPAPVP
jgi:MFS family permease